MTIIGIDPDVNKSGVCLLTDGSIEWLGNMHLWELFGYILNTENLLIIIEAGWLSKEGKELKNKSYHSGGKGSSYDVGRNSEIGRQIVKFCEAHKVNYKTYPPKGYSSVDHNLFVKITSYTGRTNEDNRVAALFALDEWKQQQFNKKIKKK